MYTVQCTTGVNWDIYVPWKDKGLRATSFSQVLVMVNTDSVNDCIIECCKTIAVYKVINSLKTKKSGLCDRVCGC